MLDYTRSAVSKIVEDFKAFLHIYTIVVQSIYLAYLIYSIAVGAGIVFISVALLVICTAYFVFYLVAHDRINDSVEKIARKTRTWLLLAVKAFTLGVSIYNIYAASTHVTPVSVTLAALTALSWIIQILVELLAKFIENRASLLIEGLKADFEGVSKTCSTVSNVIKRIKGEEVEKKEELPPTKHRLILDERVRQEREEKKAKRKADKLARKQRRRRKDEPTADENENNTSMLPR